MPGYWTQVHHVTDWKNGGRTDVNDLTLACGPENRMIERTDWDTRKNRRGQIEWVPHPTSTPANTASTATTTPNATSSPKTTKDREAVPRQSFSVGLSDMRSRTHPPARR